MTIDLQQGVDANGIPLRQSRSRFVLSQEAIIGMVAQGLAQICWRELPSHRGLYVTADVLQIAGLRVPVTAKTAARLAELLNASPTTALLEDLIWNQAELQVPMVYVDPPNLMQTNRSVFQFNDRVNAAIAEATLPSCPIVAGFGKSWILDNTIENKAPGTACNYGFYRQIAPTATHRSVDGRSYVQQTPGTAHNADHWDYSQVCRLARWGDGPVPLDRMPQHQPLRINRLWK